MPGSYDLSNNQREQSLSVLCVVACSCFASGAFACLLILLLLAGCMQRITCCCQLSLAIDRSSDTKVLSSQCCMHELPLKQLVVQSLHGQDIVPILVY